MVNDLKEHTENAVSAEADEIRIRMNRIIRAAREDRARGRYFASGDLDGWSLAAGAAFGAIVVMFVVRFVIL